MWVETGLPIVDRSQVELEVEVVTIHLVHPPQIMETTPVMAT
jgi:hypothetical protein